MDVSEYSQHALLTAGTAKVGTLTAPFDFRSDAVEA